MRSLRLALPVMILALFAQSPPAERDSQAVLVMQRAAVALSLNTPTLNPSGQAGVVITGIYYPNNDPGGSGYAVRVKILAYDKVRWEFDQPGGTVSTVVNSGVAWRTGPNGTVALPLGDMMGRQLEALPFLSLTDWLSDSSVTLKDRGMETPSSGTSLSRILIALITVALSIQYTRPLVLAIFTWIAQLSFRRDCGSNNTRGTCVLACQSKWSSRTTSGFPAFRCR